MRNAGLADDPLSAAKPAHHELAGLVVAHAAAARAALTGDALRLLAVDGTPPPAQRRLVRERPLHPQAAELTRAAALAGNQLRRLADTLPEHELAALRADLARIEAALRRCLEAV